MTHTATRAIALLSAAGIGGLCAASLAPPVDYAAVGSDGSAGIAHSAGMDQEAYRDRHQRALYSSGGARRRQRPASSEDGERFESQVDQDFPGEQQQQEQEQQQQGMFNSFSLEEQEPSCYFKARSPLRSAEAQPEQREYETGGGDVLAGPVGLSSRYYPTDREPRFGDMARNTDENNAEFGNYGPAGHYYPGRGRNAAQSLLVQAQDFAPSYGSSSKNNVAPSSSYLGHRHQPYLFNGGNPYSSGMGSGSGSEEYDGGVYFQTSEGAVDGGVDAWQQQQQELQLQQQQQQQHQHQVEPVSRAMLRIAREAGFAGLFRGTGARMMHVTSIVTVQLLIYQSIKSMVGIAS